MTYRRVPLNIYYRTISTYTRDDFPGATIDESMSGVIKTPYGDEKVQYSDPNYKVKISKGIDASLPYERVYVAHYNARPSCLTAGKTSLYYPLRFRGSYLGCPPDYGLDRNYIYPVRDNVLIDQAVASVKRKLAAQVGGMNLAVPIGELREMRGLIRSVADKGMGLLEAIASAQKGRDKPGYRLIADSWLTFSFGVKPMVSEIQKLDSAISSYILRQNRSIKLSSERSKTWHSGLSYEIAGVYGANIVASSNVRHSLSYRVTAGFNLPLASGNNYGVMEHLGLELGSLPSVGWELTPYSWLLDYFGTVGAYLEDTFTSPPGETKYVVLNTRYTADIDTYYGWRPWVQTTSMSAHMDSSYDKYVFFDRQVLRKLPRAQLRFKTVDEIGKNAVSKLLNLASLGLLKALR